MEIEDVRRLRLQPGDRLAVRVTNPDHEYLAEVGKALRQAVPDHEVLVLVGSAEDIDLTVVPAATDA